MGHDVFISYSSKDKVKADAICAGLEAQKIKCWIAPRDVLVGEEWSKSIVEAIASCKIFLLLFSDNANSSTQVIKELDCATRDEKTIIPFRLVDVMPTGSMKYYLGSLHWLDAMDPPMEKQINKLADYIAHILGFSKTESHGERIAPSDTGETETRDPSVGSKTNTMLHNNNRTKKWILFSLGCLGILIILTALIFFRDQLFHRQKPELTTAPGNPELQVSPTSVFSKVTPLVTSIPITPATSPSIGSTVISEKDGMNMVYIPGDEFLMGSPESMGSEDEHPQHSVYIDSFYIDQTEVTNAMFSKFVEETGYYTEAEKMGKSFAFVDNNWVLVSGADWQHPFGPSSSISEFDDHPVIHVSWNDARIYCEWTNKRLPTEAEWEKAARGIDGSIYPWGDARPNGNLVNYADGNTYFDWSDKSEDDGYMYTSPVGSYPQGASPYGALDMAGNVWEWVADWYSKDYYLQSPEANPSGPANGTYRVMRGGAWDDLIDGIRSAYRAAYLPTNTNGDTGFRCASDVSNSE